VRQSSWKQLREKSGVLGKSLRSIGYNQKICIDSLDKAVNKSLMFRQLD